MKYEQCPFFCKFWRISSCTMILKKGWVCPTHTKNLSPIILTGQLKWQAALINLKQIGKPITVDSICESISGRSFGCIQDKCPWLQMGNPAWTKHWKSTLSICSAQLNHETEILETTNFCKLPKHFKIRGTRILLIRHNGKKQNVYWYYKQNFCYLWSWILSNFHFSSGPKHFLEASIKDKSVCVHATF